MSIPVRALLALLALLSARPPASAEEAVLGRLFLTPGQRSALDRQRLLNPGLQANPLDSESSLTVNGEIRRSDGRRTRWINGEENQAAGPAAAANVPVGDTVYPGTGEREGLLRGGRIIIKPGGTAR